MSAPSQARVFLWVLLLGVAATLLVLALGCAPAQAPVHVIFGPGASGPLGGAHPVLQRVDVDPRAYGRQCFHVEIEPGGTVTVTYGVDASSDWASLRALQSTAGQIVAAVLSTVGAPLEALGRLLGAPPPKMPEPSNLSACSAVLGR